MAMRESMELETGSHLEQDVVPVVGGLDSRNIANCVSVERSRYVLEYRSYVEIPVVAEQVSYFCRSLQSPSPARRAREAIGCTGSRSFGVMQVGRTPARGHLPSIER